MHRVLLRWSLASRQRAEADAFTVGVPGALGLRRQAAGQERTRAQKIFTTGLNLERGVATKAIKPSFDRSLATEFGTSHSELLRNCTS